MFISIVLWAQVAVFTHVMSYDVDWDRFGTMGKAPRTRETLPDFLESVGLPDIHEYSSG